MGRPNNTRFFSRPSFLVAPSPPQEQTDSGGHTGASSQSTAACPPRLRRIRESTSQNGSIGEAASATNNTSTAPSIRCPQEQVDDEDVADLVEGEGQRPTKKIKTGKRGPVTNKNLQRRLKEMGEGRKFQLGHNGKKVIGTLRRGDVVRTIGSIIRTWIPMNKPHFDDLKEEDKELLFIQLSCMYDFMGGSHHYMLLDFIMSTARNRFRDWKHEIKKWIDKWERKHTTPENPTPEVPTPLEFLHRVDEFQWLREHFKSAAFDKLSKVGEANRKKNVHAHHGGSMTFEDRAEKWLKNNSLLPHCDAYIEAYTKEKDDNKHNVARVAHAKAITEEARSKLNSSQVTDCEDSSPTVAKALTVEEELPLIQQITKKPPKGRLQSGLGKGVIVPTMRDLHGGECSSARSTSSSEELEQLRTRMVEQEAMFAQQLEEQSKLMEDQRKDMEARLAEQAATQAKLQEMFTKIASQHFAIPDSAAPSSTPK